MHYHLFFAQLSSVIGTITVLANVMWCHFKSKYWQLLAIVGYCWLLLAIVGYCWLLLVTVGYYWLLWAILAIVGYCWLLLAIVGNCWQLLAIVGYCWLLLAIVVYCWLLLIIVLNSLWFFYIFHVLVYIKNSGVHFNQILLTANLSCADFSVITRLFLVIYLFWM